MRDKTPECRDREEKCLDLAVNNDYLMLLEQIKDKIQRARTKAAHAVNKELIELYLFIGEKIVKKQEKDGWGKAIVVTLSRDLMQEYPGKGFSSANLWFMRQVYLEYKDTPNLLRLVREIPWGQNITIITKIKDQKAREYYLQAVIEMGWSRNVLLNQIKMKAYERHRLVKKQHNFEKALPIHMAEQADQSMKDFYVLDFLGITNPILEKEMERRMVEKVKDLIMELGYGFSFLGNQYKIIAENKEYFIDLLFYHRKLKCLVALEIKTGEFKPEYAGKMNFYLNLLDDFVKETGENPSIGIILCAERDRIEVEYALRGINKPVGVAEYSFTKKLPKELAAQLPTSKELEDRILRGIHQGK